MRVAIVTGAFGQDGHWLCESLKRDGYGVLGLGRDRTASWRVPETSVVDICDETQVREIVDQYRPDEVYHLATVHESAEQTGSSVHRFLEGSLKLNVHALTLFLDSIRTINPKCRLFFASSSHVFGEPSDCPQDESTPMLPSGFYGIAKATGMGVCRHYRREHNVFASSGILYSHESPRRGTQFLVSKVVRHAVAASRGSRDPLHIGRMNARNDWGYAPDYVQAMRDILGLEKPDDFIIATGESHSVQEVIKIAFDEVELDWREFVIESPSLLRRQPQALVGNPDHLKSAVGWKPTLEFEPMIRQLVKEELQRADNA